MLVTIGANEYPKSSVRVLSGPVLGRHASLLRKVDTGLLLISAVKGPNTREHMYNEITHRASRKKLVSTATFSTLPHQPPLAVYTS